MAEFKERIKILRGERDLSYAQLAGKFAKSESAVRAWESGRTKPDVDTLLLLSHYFGVTTDYLLGRSDTRNPENPTDISDLGLSEKSINLIKDVLAKDGYNYPVGDSCSYAQVLDMMLDDETAAVLLIHYVYLATSPQLAPDRPAIAVWGDESPSDERERSRIAQQGYVKEAHDALDKIIKHVRKQAKAEWERKLYKAD